MKFKLRQGDNLELLKKLPDNSIDAVVSDPPYGLSFMNKKWDYDVPSVEFWKEVYRVLKPGGHILSFGGTRTYHRMVVNIEDAGFEIRDQIMWLYGSGFPKSHNIGKAVDKLQGNERKETGKSYTRNVEKPFEIGASGIKSGEYKETKGTSPYEGWGTALKPANEPICVARKPLSEKSVAENVLKWGTGGINIDGCRIGSDTITTNGYGDKGFVAQESYEPTSHEGRFPANIILDEIAGEMLDEQSGVSKTRADLNYKHNKTESNSEVFQSRGTYTPRQDSGGASRFFYQAKVSKKERNMGLDGFEEKQMTLTEGKGRTYNDRCANCKKKFIGPDDKICSCENPETDKTIYVQKNNHPTVKPVNLMAYLCRLVTPPGGTVLDPYMGSGSTGIAALLEGFNFIGMDLDPEYVKIAEARISDYENYREFLK